MEGTIYYSLGFFPSNNQIFLNLIYIHISGDIIAKDGKQVSFRLEQIQTNDGLTVYSETYHFKPEIEDLNKHVTLKVSGGTDIDATLAKLGLPNTKGDLVTIEINVTQVQSKLIKAEEKSEEKEEEKTE